MDFLFESHAEEKEKTEVLDDEENAVSRGVQFMQNVRKCMDLFGDKKWSIFLSYIRGPSITFQVLFYPVTDACFATPSYNTLHEISRSVLGS